MSGDPGDERALGVDVREGAQQRPGIRVPRPLVDRHHVTHLGVPARVHHRDPVTGLRDHGQVVRDEDHREPQLRSQVAQQLQDLGLDHHVQRGHRLIGDHQLRPAGQRHRDHRPLAHAAGELVRVAAAAGGRDAHEVQQLRHPPVHLGPRHGGLVAEDGLRDLCGDRGDRVQRIHGALEDHGDALPADVGQLLLGDRGEVLALEQHLPGHARGGRQQAGDREGGGGLATPGLANQAQRLPRLQDEREAVHGVDLALGRGVLHAQVAQLQQGHR